MNSDGIAPLNYSNPLESSMSDLDLSLIKMVCTIDEENLEIDPNLSGQGSADADEAQICAPTFDDSFTQLSDLAYDYPGLDSISEMKVCSIDVYMPDLTDRGSADVEETQVCTPTLVPALFQSVPEVGDILSGGELVNGEDAQICNHAWVADSLSLDSALCHGCFNVVGLNLESEDGWLVAMEIEDEDSAEMPEVLRVMLRILVPAFFKRPISV